MEYFENYKIVDLIILKEKRVYSEEIITAIEENDYIKLKSPEVISPEQRQDINFMGPIVYAYQKQNGSYIAYKACGKDLQTRLDFAIDIIKEDPKVIEDTWASANRAFIEEISSHKPEVVKYMSEDLQLDSVFIRELCELNNREVIINVAKECDISQVIKNNPELLSNKEFLIGAVIKDASYLEQADESSKNDYEFIRETTKENYEVVEYVVKNTAEFGVEAIAAAKDTTKEIAVGDYMQVIEELSECSDDPRYKKVKDKVIEKGTDDIRTLKWITAMVAQSDKVSPEMLKKVLDYSVLEMSKIKKDLTEEKKEKVSIENAYELITPKILNRLKENAIKQGGEIDKELETRIKEYEEFYKEYMEKLREKKREKLEKSKEQNSKNINLENVEMITESASLEEIKEETKIIREEIGTLRDNLNHKNVENIGEQKNKDDEQRT